MKRIKFYKLNGQGNDFILIDATISNIELEKDSISRLCDRHFGIGADGLILIRNSKAGDFFMDYYNHDGSVAEMCGNGIRCMAAFINDKIMPGKNIFNIDTRAGIKKIEIKTDGNIKVDMGPPVFEPEYIPVLITEEFLKSDNYQESIYINNVKFLHNYPVSAYNQVFNVNCVSMGNPHCVIIVKESIDLYGIPLHEWGPALENNPVFPEKTNVEFIKIVNEKEIQMRVWERGAGETLACGTGACAAAVCSIMLEKIEQTEIPVHLPGGILKIYWNNVNEDLIKNSLKSVYLEGKVKFVFEGYFII